MIKLPNTEKEQIDLLYKAIKQLNESDRAIILLYLEKKSYQEISEILGMTVSNVIDVSSSVSSRTTTLEGTGTIQGVGQGNAVTFATVDTGQGANEVYAMDQALTTGDSPTFATVYATTKISSTV